MIWRLSLENAPHVFVGVREARQSRGRRQRIRRHGDALLGPVDVGGAVRVRAKAVHHGLIGGQRGNELLQIDQLASDGSACECHVLIRCS